LLTVSANYAFIRKVKVIKDFSTKRQATTLLSLQLAISQAVVPPGFNFG
jgi:hypothetical protein